MKKAEPDSPAESKQSPTTTKGPVDVIIQKRGGSDTRHQASPDPHTAHIPKAKVQVVCE